MRVLITGVAGFIGYHLAKKLLERGDEVCGVDNLTDFIYDKEIKCSRLLDLKLHKSFTGSEFDITNEFIFSNFGIQPYDCIVHLAAHASVRPSIDHSQEYINANIVGFQNIIDCARNIHADNFVYASSSSVYGDSIYYPSKESEQLDKPISLYAATKKSNELVAHVYSDMWKMNCTGLRFFTVYGPWGRPDMALMKFIKNILDGRPIDLYNHGNMCRDFTYIDDIIDGVVACIDDPKQFAIYNLGCGRSERLTTFVEVIEEACGKKALINKLDMQPGDVQTSYACMELFESVHGKQVRTPISVGIPKTVEWFKDYYGY